MPKPTLYLSFDIETDGNNPLLNNLLAIGICGLDSNAKVQYQFSSNILPISGKIRDQQTMNFWAKNKIIWDKLQENQVSYYDVFNILSGDLEILSEEWKLVFVANPACFGWMFLKCYYEDANNFYSGKLFDIGYKCECASTAWNIYKNLYMSDLSGDEINEIADLMGDVDKNLLHDAFYDAMFQGIRYIRVMADLSELDVSKHK